METVSYVIERRDTHNFHGWVVFACYEDWEEEILATTSLKMAKAFLKEMTT